MNLHSVVKYGLPIAAAAAVLVFLAAVSRILLPFALGLALAYAANPAIRFVQSRGWKRGLGVAALCLAVVLLALAVGCLGLPALVKESGDFHGQWSGYAQRIAKTLCAAAAGGMDSGYRESIPKGREFVEYLRRNSGELAGMSMRLFPSVGRSMEQVLWLAVTVFLAPLVAVFAMLRGPAFLRAVLKACPSRHVESALDLLWLVDASVGRYLRGVFIRAVAVGLLTFVGLKLAGLGYAVWFSSLAAAANFLPWIGPLLAALAALACAALESRLVENVAGGMAFTAALGSDLLPLYVTAVFAAVKTLDYWVIRRVVHKQTAELHFLVLAFALLCGWILAGIAGFIFAATAAGALKLLWDAVWAWYRREFRLRPPSGRQGAEAS